MVARVVNGWPGIVEGHKGKGSQYSGRGIFRTRQYRHCGCRHLVRCRRFSRETVRSRKTAPSGFEGDRDRTFASRKRVIAGPGRSFGRIDRIVGRDQRRSCDPEESSRHREPDADNGAGRCGQRGGGAAAPQLESASRCRFYLCKRGAVVSRTF